MPAVASLSEFNRNQSAVIDRLERSQEPMYLTKNGKASVVVMDAAAFDQICQLPAAVMAASAEESKVFPELTVVEYHDHTITLCKYY